MADDKLKQKGRADEEQFFRRRDEELLQKLRRETQLGEITAALAERLQVDDPDLLQRITGHGVTLETGPAFMLAPLVQVAWAEGKVTGREKRAVLGIAEKRGIERGSPSYQLLERWLDERPPDALFAAAVEAIRVGLTVLPPDERTRRIEQMVDLCRQIAATSGGLARELGLSSGIQDEEKAILEAITRRLTAG